MNTPRVAMSILSRGWTMASGSFLLVAAPYFLSLQELGVFYAFGSLLALQIFFDLGLNYVVMQVAAADFVYIGRRADNQIQDGETARRLSSLIHLLRRWYGAAALLFCLAAGCAGAVFFSTTEDLDVQWAGPWVGMCILAAVNLYLSPFLSVDEASGKVHQVALLRLVCSVLGTTLFVAALASGLHLWAASLNLMPLALGATWWLTSRHSTALQLLRLTRDVAAVAAAAKARWKQDILPFQWRLSLSWISGYFLYQLITPMVFKVAGPDEAGKFGLGLAICNSLLGLGAAWMNAIAPNLVRAIEEKSFAASNELIDRHMGRSAFLLGALLTVAAIVPYLAALKAPQIAARLPSVLDMSLLAISAYANYLVYAMATWLRSFRLEKLLMPSVTSAAVTIAAVTMAAHFGANWIAFAYAFSILFVLLPWATIIYRVERRKMTGSSCRTY